MNTLRQFAHSPNGVRWLLVKDKVSGEFLCCTTVTGIW
jgi:hypothetical protein